MKAFKDSAFNLSYSDSGITCSKAMFKFLPLLRMPHFGHLFSLNCSEHFKQKVCGHDDIEYGLCID